jgi:uncharacterized protein YgiM (DUF1202 family)
MLRLTLLLCLGMFAALMTLGEDRGQLRPGLALAAAEGRLDDVWAEARARAQPAPALPAAEDTARTLPVVLAAAPAPALAPDPAPLPEPSPVVASIVPTIDITPGREVVQRLEEPVFTLSALGNEAVPGEDGVPLAPVAAGAPSEVAPAPETAAGGEVWYVNASSVNVRAGPSTETDILGKLGTGEAALVVAEVDGEWAQIVIQGDGLEGFVALRYLSPAAP